MEENRKTYFDYDKNGKRITDDNTYFPDLLKDKETNTFEIGYYGHSNMGRFLMITGEIKDLLKYSDGQDILKDIYEKNVNRQLKKDFEKCFYNNKEFNTEITLNKFKPVKDLLSIPTNTLSKEELSKNFIYNKMEDKFSSYIYNTRTNRDVSSYEYKAKNNLFNSDEKNFFPQEIKEANKDSFIFEKIIDYAISHKENLNSFQYNDNFSSLVYKFSEKFKQENLWNKENDLDDKSNAWNDKVTNDKNNDLER